MPGGLLGVAAALPWPDDAPDVWHACSIGGFDLPGLVAIGVECSEKLDVKEPVGGSGGTITDQGPSPSKVTIEHRMWEPEHFALFQAVLPILRTKVGKGPSAQPLEIDHPKALLWGITRVAINHIADPPSNGSSPGNLYVIKYQCVEYRPPPKASATTTLKGGLGKQNNVIATVGGDGARGGAVIENSKKPSAQASVTGPGAAADRSKGH